VGTRVRAEKSARYHIFSRVRDTARRVQRWQGGMMILRWTAAGVLEAERHFRKVAGYRGLPKAGCGVARTRRCNRSQANI
jgi:hypothetical protein